MATYIPGDNSWFDSFKQAGNNLTQSFMGRADENALKKSIEDLGPNASARDILNALTNAKTYSNEAKQQALSNYLGVENFNELKRKAMAQEELQAEKNQISAMGKQGQQDREQTINNFMAQGYNREEAEALTNPYVPNSVKQGISKRVEGELARSQRSGQIQSETAIPSAEMSNKSNTKAVIEKASNSKEMPLEAEDKLAPLDAAIEKAIEPTTAKPKDEWPKLLAPANTTASEQEKWRDKNQTFNNKLLKETKDKSNSHTNALLRYSRLNTLNNSRKLPEGMGRLVINPETSEPYAVASLLGLVNKETQDFVKTMNDFMIDAKNYFGSRVTNFDIQAFKSRLPTLLNTPDGRRLIIEQMKLMEDLQIVHDQELEKGLKHYGRNASYSDIQSVVDERTETKEDTIINKINNLDQAASYMDLMANDPKFKGMVLMQSKEGKFKAIPQNKVSEAKSKGYIAW